MALGKWIANSEIGTLEDKYLFICNLTCPDCRKKDGYIVILKLGKGTAINLFSLSVRLQELTD